MGERHVIVGAGPAGLTAAWLLARRNKEVLLLEQDPRAAGGLARTMELQGHRYDLGPHRFYTKSDEIQEMWREMLPEGLMEVKRRTRVFYEGKFYSYPLSLGETLRGIGPRRAARALCDCLGARLSPRRPEASFEDWVVNRFGRELYETFFRTYTEKVWGVPCAELDKDWAAQRIRGLSLVEMLRKAVLGPLRGRGARSLVDRFLYPRLGAGQLWESALDDVLRRGGRIETGEPVVRVRHRAGRVECVESASGRSFAGTHFYLTMTLRNLVRALDPPPPPEVLTAGEALRHRDLITAVLIVERQSLFPDQWIYVHAPDVRVARITNYANWSEDMCPDSRTTAIGMEYFCARDDGLFGLDDSSLLALARQELEHLGLSHAKAAAGGRVHRSLDAYPVYDAAYRRNREILKRWIGAALANAYPAGRKGLHNYNSQDHAMMTGVLSVRNALDGARHDVWSVNTLEEYAEEGTLAARDPLRAPRRGTPGN
ncbi:MAG: NAD(P)/FAD-dependent oxidoreductase [Planctomycetes bacterium]|nr:NAD(P)/FAD-dependent oxidoreductase [Planctomycetota bacterium]